MIVQLEKYHCSHMNRLTGEIYLILSCSLFGHLHVQDGNPSNAGCAFKGTVLVFISLILCYVASDALHTSNYSYFY